MQLRSDWDTESEAVFNMDEWSAQIAARRRGTDNVVTIPKLTRKSIAAEQKSITNLIFLATSIAAPSRFWFDKPTLTR